MCGDCFFFPQNSRFYHKIAQATKMQQTKPACADPYGGLDDSTLLQFCSPRLQLLLWPSSDAHASEP